MTDTTERDRLVELLADRLVGDPYRPARLSAPDAEELADVLIANGWSRTVHRPEVDAEVEWGVRYSDGTVDPMVSRIAAENTIAFRGEFDLPGTLMTRTTVGPWQEAQ